MSPGDIGLVCPRCKGRVRERLSGGRVCRQCESTEAWTRYGAPDNKLTISIDDVDEADARRARGLNYEPLISKQMHVLSSAIAVAAAATGLVFLAGLLSPQELRPLDDIREDIVGLARRTTGFGLLGFVIAVAATIRLRGGVLFRSRPLIASNLLAMIAGTVGLLLGGMHWSTMQSDWRYSSMPAQQAAAVVSPLTRKIMDATAVILAPDENGDARSLSIGAGTVIDSAAHRALIVTSSHVAMPYAAVAARRDAAEAWPVFVYLADGRSTIGRVEWTARPPLDVALIAVDIARPPKPVEVSVSARAIDPGARVTFVPNPFRLGWMFHDGKVTKRDSHITPVGEYSLLFTDLPVQPGDSGTGLYDDSGRLIGINTWSRLEPDGPIGISLPSDTMQSILRSAGVEASAGVD